ncbi:MAG: hypothetical protein GY948_13910 [Alphaproteobacteria bacterium]|nr:hypothetical protein [Alphaproteobacteria bacterium]
MSLRPNLLRPARRTLHLALAALVLFLGVQSSGADETPSGFKAQIDGAYEGQVSGSGVLVFLANAGFEKKGYYFLADGRGIRPHGVTFGLPHGVASGRHELTSPSPFDLGSVPSVRVDRDMGNATVSSEKNTSGSLTLTTFPADKASLSGSKVAGHFEFQTEGRDGQTIKVSGAFSFQVK